MKDNQISDTVLIELIHSVEHVVIELIKSMLMKESR